MEATTQARRSIKAQSGAVSPAKFAHFVLVTRDLTRLRDWYVTVLHGRVVYQDPILCFITYDDEHHRIAIGAFPGVEEREPGVRVGLHHTAFTYRDLGELLYTYRRLKAGGIEPYWCVNHGPTTSMYYRDPDGNRVELQVDNFATAEDATDSCGGTSQKTRLASCSSPRSSLSAGRPASRWSRCARGRSCRRARRHST